jgi:hypothetical protein
VITSNKWFAGFRGGGSDILHIAKRQSTNGDGIGKGIVCGWICQNWMVNALKCEQLLP